MLLDLLVDFGENLEEENRWFDLKMGIITGTPLKQIKKTISE